MISKIQSLLVKKNLVGEYEKIRFLKMPSRRNKNCFIPVLIFLANSENPSFIAKIFKNQNNVDLFDYIIERNLKIRNKLGGSALLEALPEAFIYDRHHKLFVESFCEGKNIVPLFSKAVRGQSHTFKLVLVKVLEWLIAFHKHTLTASIPGNNLYIYFTKDELDILAEIFGTKYSLILSFLHRIHFHDGKIPLTYCHKDFNAYNVKIYSDNVKVYDWEDFSERDVPLLDFFHLFTVPVISNNSILGDYKKNFVKYICHSSPFRIFFSKHLSDYSKCFNIGKEFTNWYYLAYLLKMCLKERNDFRYDGGRESVWADIAIEYLEIANGKLLV